jgi:preprotein translocase subunit YajC
MISLAYAQAAPAAAPSAIEQLLQGPLLLVGMIVLMYFLLFRPQMKRAKEHRQMVAGLQKGDEVVIGGGTLGKVTNVGDSYVKVEIAPSVEITVQRPSIQTLLPKGTIKSAS